MVRRPHPRRPRTGGRVSAEPHQQARAVRARADPAGRLRPDRRTRDRRRADRADREGGRRLDRARPLPLPHPRGAAGGDARLRLRRRGRRAAAGQRGQRRVRRGRLGRAPARRRGRAVAARRPTRAAGSGSSGPSCGSGPRATRACARSPRRCTRATAPGSRRPSPRASPRASSPVSIRATRPIWPWRSSTGSACGCCWATRRCRSNALASASGRSSPASFSSPSRAAAVRGGRGPDGPARSGPPVL